MSIRAIASALLFFLLSACVAACDDAAEARGSRGPGISPCTPTTPCGTPPPRSVGSGIVVENATDDVVTLAAAEARELRIDHAVREGLMPVPIPRALFVDERREPLAAGEIISVGSEIEIVTAAGEAIPRPAAAIGVGSEPLFLAIGSGRVLVRKHFDGTRTLEAEDSRAVTLLPIDGAFSECAAPALIEGYAIEGDSAIGSVATPVTSVTKDDDGCRVFAVQDDYDRAASVRVCIPDAAYPFADSDVLDVRVDQGSAELGSTWLVENADGVTMRLVHGYFSDRMTETIESLTLGADDVPSCARVDECGNVDVPAKLTFSFAGKSARPVVFGEAITDPAAPSRTFVVMSARARPIANGACVAPGAATTDSFRAHAWVAMIDRRPKPTP